MISWWMRQLAPKRHAKNLFLVDILSDGHPPTRAHPKLFHCQRKCPARASSSIQLRPFLALVSLGALRYPKNTSSRCMHRIWRCIKWIFDGCDAIKTMATPISPPLMALRCDSNSSIIAKETLNWINVVSALSSGSIHYYYRLCNLLAPAAWHCANSCTLSPIVATTIPLPFSRIEWIEWNRIDGNSKFFSIIKWNRSA